MWQNSASIKGFTTEKTVPLAIGKLDIVFVVFEVHLGSWKLGFEMV